MNGFLERDRRVHLTSIIGLGEFGSNVIESLGRYSALLPPPVATALVFKHVPAAASATESLTASRDHLANRTTLEAIRDHGGVLEDEGVEFYSVRHVLVCDAGESAAASDAVKAIQGTHPRDAAISLVHCLKPKAFLGTETCRALSTCVVSPDQCTGLKAVDLPGIVAGVLLVSLMPGGQDLFEPGGKEKGAFGFSGYYGLAGEILDRLSAHLSAGLIKCHEAKEQPGSPEPDIVAAIIADFAPKALGLRLFDRRMFEGTNLQPIPAAPSWAPDGTFTATLGAGAVSVQLPHARPHQWPELLKRLSRAHDMTTASLWRIQLDKAARKISKSIDERFEAMFKEILDSLPHSPFHAERVLDTLEAEVEQKRTALPGSGGGLDSDLEALKEAISARPNPYALAGRTGLFIVPLLAACLKMFPALYEPLRSNLFSVLLVLALGGIGVGYVFWRLYQAHRNVIAKRDKAIASMVSRQEALLSENAVACVEELVQKLKLEIKACRAHLELCRRNLEASRKNLETVLDQPIHDNECALRAIITDRPEFEQLAAKLNVDEEAWLKDAVGKGLFSKLYDAGFNMALWTKGLTRFCSDGVLFLQRTMGISLKDLRSLQTDTRRRSTEEVLQQLTDYAAPAVSKIDGADEKHFFVPTELRDEVSSIYDGKKYSPSEEVHAVDAQILACVRKARVPAEWVRE